MCYKKMSSYRIDDFIENGLGTRLENAGLAILAASCVVGIIIIRRL